MRKIFTILAFALILCSATQLTMAQRGNWLMEDTQLIIPGGEKGDFVDDEVIQFFYINHHNDYQGTKVPSFVITDRKARAMFTIGGFAEFRTAYDFTAVMPNLDFIPSQISMYKNYSNEQRALMDASTSRLFFEAIMKTGSGMPVVAYVETDFRGVDNALRLRQAYVSYAGFKFGQATSTFTDLNAAFNTIDFEGPNAYTYSRNLMVQYTNSWRSGLSMGVALEYPVVNATYNDYTGEIYQRVPDVPIYLQYAWGEGCSKSHIRLSAIMRNMYYADLTAQSAIDKIGWGAQFSASFGLGKVARLYGQFLYGEGMSPYIQDLQGLPYDMVADKSNMGKMLTLPAMAYFAGVQFNLCEQVPLTLGYSQVTLYNRDHYLSSDDYHIGQYIVANCFYNISRAWSVGAEYLYGMRHDFEGDFGRSQRAQVAIKFNF